MNEILVTAYVDDFSILVINGVGVLRRLYTPFRVQCIEVVEGLTAGSWVYVEAVKKDDRDKLLYCIQGRALPYNHFRIHIKF